MISFALDEDQQLIQDTVRDFAREVMRPAMRAWEKAGGVPDETRRRFHELGLALVDVPEDLGGAGAGAVTSAIVHEELAFGDPGAAVALCGPHLAAHAIRELGTPEQARRWLARFAEQPGSLGAVAWSEQQGAPLHGFATTARRKGGGYLLDGAKAFVTNGGRADATVVFAQLEGSAGWAGTAAFVVDGSNPGLVAGPRHELLGLETVHVGSLTLAGCRVAEEDRLLGGDSFDAAVGRFFLRAVLVNAARQVGLARAAYENALAYTQDRRAFGKPVAHFQAIAFMLADMLMDVESARWMVWRAASRLDQGRPDLAAAAEAGAHAAEAAWRVADQGVQLLGGAGYIQDFPAEKWMRDTKVLALCAPSAEQLALATARAQLDDGLDPTWPSSAIQPIIT